MKYSNESVCLSRLRSRNMNMMSFIFQCVHGSRQSSTQDSLLCSNILHGDTRRNCAITRQGFGQLKGKPSNKQEFSWQSFFCKEGCVLGQLLDMLGLP